MTQGCLRILILEDDPALAEVLCDGLGEHGHTVVAAHSVAEATEQLGRRDFDVALLDLMLPDGSGIDVLRRIASEDLPTEAIVLTGFAEVSTAIEAMKLGAYDYLTKPARFEELEVLVAKAAEKGRLRRENVSLRLQLQRQDVATGIVTQDPGVAELLGVLDRVAPSELPVLLQGESGTGKELVARALHKKSPRASQPFVALNCAAVPESLLESELFGHEKGAFTGAVARKPGLFEVADRGVLFLDEIGDVAPAVQAKLLRVIETKELRRVGSTRPLQVDVRIVSASNKDLRAETEAGRFREDLYFRLNGVTLRLPPLRERPHDIPLLARHFLHQLGGKKTLSSGAEAALVAYAWPGNVRELQMVIHRALILSPGPTIAAVDLPGAPARLAAAGDWAAAAAATGLSLDELEREYIKTTLTRHQGHRGQTAKALGIDPKTLYNKLGADKPRRRD